MTSRLWIYCSVALCLFACGSNPEGPNISELPLYNTELIIEPGAFTVTGFVVDQTLMEGPLVVGSVSSTGGVTGTINLLIMNLVNFELWEKGEPYGAIYESGQTLGGTFEAPIESSDNYVLIFSNRSDPTSQKVVVTAVSLLYQKTSIP